MKGPFTAFVLFLFAAVLPSQQPKVVQGHDRADPNAGGQKACKNIGGMMYAQINTRKSDGHHQASC